MTQQFLEGIFKEKGYREGQVFKRKNNEKICIGCSTYSGEYTINCDGVVMKFNDGREVLSDFCELINYDCPDVLWAVSKDIETINRNAQEKIERIIQEYNQIKL